MLILAIDPGETTGYVVAEEFGGLDYDIKISGQFPNWQQCETLITTWKPNVVICESFHLSPSIAKYKTRSTLPTVEVIGVLAYLVRKYQIQQIISQLPSVKEFVSLPRHVAGVTGPHTRDALKHLIAYLRRTNENS